MSDMQSEIETKDYIENIIRSKVYDILTELKVDIDDPNFKETPKRHTQWILKYIDKERSDNSVKHLEKVFPSKNDEMLSFGPIPVYMLCPHHLCPALMKVWFIYIPDGKVVGLSKIPRFLKDLAHFPMLQEEYTRIALDKFTDKLAPVGAMCYVEGLHTCTILRGVETITPVKSSAITKLFRENPNVKREALHMIHGGTINVF